jgi:hypothetical protein
MGASQPVAVQDELERVVAPLENLIGALVPDLDGRGAVLAFGDCSLERSTFEWMVGYLHGQPAGSDGLRDRLGDGLAFQGTIPFEPEVVMH